MFLLAAAAMPFALSLKISPANSPFMVDSALTVDTLIVEEGSSLFFKSATGITVKKLFVSNGRSLSGIVYASGEASPTQFDWNGITVLPHATAAVKHSKFSHCIECLRSASGNVVLDSVSVQEFGQDAVVIKDSLLAPLAGLYFYAEAGPKAGKKHATWPYLAAGGAAIMTVPVLYFLLRPEKEGEEDVQQGNTIKYPNLPEL
jgi:hypothetical protein